ncbi:MAG: tetratricopeptide repeat protein [Candidatus Cloacimonadaceae bacterium]|nr:tetratricopeptide repeat protein [Candidatus Cloacimonadaceae bacterium]
MKRFRLVPLVLMVALFSCGLNNTMYNAKKYYKSALERPLNTNGRPTPQAIADYTKTIQKCGIIITEHKNRKIMDDALFLMAKALYYKGNSAFQAKDQFEALIAGFPDSKHVPEAHIFLARVLREINRPQEAEMLLEQFVRDPRFRDHHPQALLVLTEFEILDKDYYRAQFWLEKIINEYPQTKQYGEGFFLFGRNYYVQKDYEASLREFKKLVAIRRITKDLRLEARYYIALNHFHLRNYDQSSQLVSSLIRDEFRPDKLAQVRVLRARLFFAQGKDAEGINEIEDLGKTSARTAAAAEAFFHLGEFHFYKQNDITKATTAYNRVRAEFPNSEYVPVAQSKVAALNQLKQNQNLSLKTNLQQFVDYHVLSAEKYFDPLALPDSSLAMYDRLIKSDAGIIAERDSLQASLMEKQASMALLNTIPRADSIAATDPPDSTNVPKDIPQPQNAEKRAISADIKSLETRIAALDVILLRLNSEIIPFAYFAQASLYNKAGKNQDRISGIFAIMQERFPLNKYTNALRALRAGNPVRLVDPIEEAQEIRLDHAFGLYESAPDSMKTILAELSVSVFNPIRLKANFRLGWHYFIEVKDTTAAKPYFNETLKLEKIGNYATLIRRLYDGTSFIFNKQRPVPDSLKVAIPDMDEEQPDPGLDEAAEDVEKKTDEEIQTDVDVADKPKTEELPPPPETPEIPTQE